MRAAAGRVLIPCRPGGPRPGAVRAWRRAGTSGTRCGQTGARPSRPSWGGTAGGHHNDERTVGLVLDLGTVDGHRLVVVVVGVEQPVPQAHVPEDALGRT